MIHAGCSCDVDRWLVVTLVSLCCQEILTCFIHSFFKKSLNVVIPSHVTYNILDKLALSGSWCTGASFTSIVYDFRTWISNHIPQLYGIIIIHPCPHSTWLIWGMVQDETPSASLHKKLGIKAITAVLRGGQLRWYGHVQRAISCIKSVTDLSLPGPRGKRRPWKTWSECVKTEIRECGLAGIDLQDRGMENRRTDIACAANPIGWDMDSTLI